MVKCFCCFKDLRTLFDSDDCISEGTSLKFIGNYGSRFDGDYGKIYICDGCVDSRVNTVFSFKGNYIEEHELQNSD